MKRGMHFRPAHAATLVGAVAGALLLFLPAFALESLTSAQWEVEVLRFVGLVTAWLGLMWARERSGTGRTLRPSRRRAAVAWGMLAAYLLMGTGLLLIIGFSLLIAAALEMSLERALAYWEGLRRQVGDRSPPPPSPS